MAERKHGWEEGKGREGKGRGWAKRSASCSSMKKAGGRAGQPLGLKRLSHKAGRCVLVQWPKEGSDFPVGYEEWGQCFLRKHWKRILKSPVRQEFPCVCDGLRLWNQNRTSVKSPISEGTRVLDNRKFGNCQEISLGINKIIQEKSTWTELQPSFETVEVSVRTNLYPWQTWDRTVPRVLQVGRTMGLAVLLNIMRGLEEFVKKKL